MCLDLTCGPPPVQLNIWGPQLLAQIRDVMELLTTARVLQHLMRYR